MGKMLFFYIFLGLKQGLSKRGQMKTIFNFLEGQSGSLKKNLVLIIEGIKGSLVNFIVHLL